MDARLSWSNEFSKNVSEYILFGRGTFLRFYLQNLRSLSDPKSGQETAKKKSIENYRRGR